MIERVLLSNMILFYSQQIKANDQLVSFTIIHDVYIIVLKARSIIPWALKLFSCIASWELDPTRHHGMASMPTNVGVSLKVNYFYAFKYYLTADLRVCEGNRSIPLYVSFKILNIHTLIGQRVIS